MKYIVLMCNDEKEMELLEMFETETEAIKNAGDVFTNLSDKEQVQKAVIVGEISEEMLEESNNWDSFTTFNEVTVFEK